ncbi:hypothetical protein [Halalkalibacter akibai]|uniref:Uncharacterized protein n=1 Tax=Halalkalibacter akibai (strain ATCC 43226 / DSM 21942 / CIP 109018 / JCM 9157 / 1139) TaxID=1236973 RepID=W4QYN3_HALA3|nr:hypothetical protein [Halalkalibacter akibai]GAE37002.1 hypothetical protein JCM9157_4243 [Halalkalibacter akibai JCM 9157]
MMKRLMSFVLLLFVLQLSAVNVHAHGEEGQASLIVKSSSESFHQTVLKIKSDKLVRTLFEAKPVDQVKEVPFSNQYILLEDLGEIHFYSVDEHGTFYDVETKHKLEVPVKTKKKVMSYFKGLHQHHFGTLKPWKEVNELLPRYASFTILDLETGLRFQAQRRAGKNHADVQPLTRADTAIMKKIYDGKWSWKRRAVLVFHEDTAIAASMHGMPHGGGALANNFPGHFCIHYKDSLTHSTRNLDLSHQIMVNKAGGKLAPFVQQLSAPQVVETFMIALNQQDLDLLQLVHNENPEQSKVLIENVESIRLVKKNNPASLDGDLVYELPLNFKIQEKGHKERDSSFVFRLKRTSPTDPWKIEPVLVEQLLN